MTRRRKKRKHARPDDHEKPTDATGRSAGDAERSVGPKWLALIFFVALGFRVMCFASVGSHPLLAHPIVDAGYHHAWAQRIVAGDLLGHGPDDVFKPPLYSYFLAAHYALFGPRVALIQWSQLLLGAASSVLLAIIAARLLGRNAGRIAGLIFALYAPFVFFELQLLTPPLSTFLNLAALLLLLPRDGAPSYRRLLGAGLAVGLSAGVRPDVLVPAALVFAYLALTHFWKKWPQMVLAGTCFAAGAAAVLIPIAARNYHLTGQFVPVSSNAGINFYIGNGSEANGISAIPVGLRWQILVGRVPQAILEKPADSSRWWMDRAKEEIRTEPGEATMRLAGKGLAFFNRREFRNNICYHYLQQFSPPLRRSPLQYAVLIPLAACGMILLAQRGTPTRRALAVCLLWVAGYWIVGVAFFVTARFRLPAVPILILAASWAIAQIAQAVSRRDRKTLAGAAVVITVTAAISTPMWFGKPAEGWVRDQVNLGNSLKQSDAPHKTAEAYRRALSFDSNDPDARFLLAQLLLPSDPAAAMEHLEVARQAAPNSPDLLLSVARAQLATGKPDLARQTLHELLSLEDRMNLLPARTSWAMAHIHLADLEPEQADSHWSKAWEIDRRTAAEVCFMQKKELPRVVKAFRADAQEKPWDWYSQANLGLALLETGQPDEALPFLMRARRLAPEKEGIRFQHAKALFDSGRREDSATALEALLDDLPASPLRRQALALYEKAKGED